MIDPIILVRGLHFAATVVAGGTVSFLALVAEPAVALRRRLTLLIWNALALAVLTGAAWLLLLAADLTGEPILEIGGAWTVLTETRFGQIAGARLGLAVTLAVLIMWPRARSVAVATAASFIALLGWIGHAGATPGVAGGLQLGSDVVHLLAAGAWLGGLPALAMLLAHARGDPTRRAFTATIVRRFGTLGLICVAALVVSGLFNGWNLLASPRDLLTSDYGRLLLLKLGLVAAMLALAAANRYRLTPRTAEPHAMRALQRNSWAEASLGFGVLLLVGALGALPPTAHRHEHARTTQVSPDAAFVHIHDVAAMAEITITPGRIGLASALIRLLREDGNQLAIKEVWLALDPPKATTQSTAQPALRQPDGSWTVQRLEIGQAGNWIVRVIVAPDSGPRLTFDAPVVIEP